MLTGFPVQQLWLPHYSAPERSRWKVDPTRAREVIQNAAMAGETVTMADLNKQVTGQYEKELAKWNKVSRVQVSSVQVSTRSTHLLLPDTFCTGILTTRSTTERRRRRSGRCSSPSCFLT
jgi:hypothetical protein